MLGSSYILLPPTIPQYFILSSHQESNSFDIFQVIPRFNFQHLETTVESTTPSRNLTRQYQRNNHPRNLKLGEEVQRVAAREGVSAAQLLLAWVRTRGEKGPVGKGRLTVAPIPGTSREERVRENLKEVEVREEVVKELEGILEQLGVSGGRYNKHMEDQLYV